MFNHIQEQVVQSNTNMESKNKVLTEEEKARKQKVSTRLFALLVGIDILLVAYLVYEMISIFAVKKG